MSVNAAPPVSDWEVVVVGGGPAGLAAGLQSARAGRRTALIERGAMGGQARRLSSLENVPGWPGGVSGSRLMSLWARQARAWGLSPVKGTVTGLRRRGGAFAVRLADGRFLTARAVVLAPGAAFKRLGVPGERRLFGNGVHHGAFDEAPRWRGRVVAVAGGGEAAVHQAVHLARWARRVVLIARGPLRAHRLLLERLAACPNVEILEGRIARVEGRARVESLAVRGGDGRIRFLPVSALFVLIGAEASPWARRAAEPGVFLAGDARGCVERQVTVAAGDGMGAAVRALRWLPAGV
ncbi:MAG: NAD(P)/FAD-dependent oxidoreductase [Elusimicrobiota bacterium]